MFRRALSRFTIAALAAAVATGLAGYAPANAEPPTHDKSIVKDVEATIPPLAECPAGNAASIDLVFHDIFHLHFTDTTFHVTATQTGTFVTRSATGDELASGHFTTTLSDQGPGFPKESFTSHINATGKATDGTQVRIHIAQHFTINANGDVTVDRFTAGCN
ncbi:MAG TPA: hypothetical protein VKD21_02570 [Acidimicrobiales bacterium]|nr:hypothetical protein [Acidimicrobiales bacterium]